MYANISSSEGGITETIVYVFLSKERSSLTVVMPLNTPPVYLGKYLKTAQIQIEMIDSMSHLVCSMAKRSVIVHRNLSPA